MIEKSSKIKGAAVNLSNQRPDVTINA